MPGRAQHSTAALSRLPLFVVLGWISIAYDVVEAESLTKSHGCLNIRSIMLAHIQPSQAGLGLLDEKSRQSMSDVVFYLVIPVVH